MFAPSRAEIKQATIHEIYYSIYDLHNMGKHFRAIYAYANGDRSRAIVDSLKDGMWLEELDASKNDTIKNDMLLRRIDLIDQQIASKLDQVAILVGTPYIDEKTAVGLIQSTIDRDNEIERECEEYNLQREQEDSEESSGTPPRIFTWIIAFLFLATMVLIYFRR